MALATAAWKIACCERRRYAAPGQSVWNWLAVAQHHRLPTRLLDWTYSPYMALHFATNHAHYDSVDSVIWCIHYVKTNQLLAERLRSLLRDEGTDVVTAVAIVRRPARISPPVYH